MVGFGLTVDEGKEVGEFSLLEASQRSKRKIKDHQDQFEA